MKRWSRTMYRDGIPFDTLEPGSFIMDELLLECSRALNFETGDIPTRCLMWDAELDLSVSSIRISTLQELTSLMECSVTIPINGLKPQPNPFHFQTILSTSSYVAPSCTTSRCRLMGCEKCSGFLSQEGNGYVGIRTTTCSPNRFVILPGSRLASATFIKTSKLKNSLMR